MLGPGVDLVLEFQHATESLSLRVGVPRSWINSRFTFRRGCHPELLDTADFDGASFANKRRRIEETSFRRLGNKDTLRSDLGVLFCDFGVQNAVCWKTLFPLELGLEIRVEDTGDSKPVWVEAEPGLFTWSRRLRCWQIEELM